MRINASLSNLSDQHFELGKSSFFLSGVNNSLKPSPALNMNESPLDHWRNLNDYQIN